MLFYCVIACPLLRAVLEPLKHRVIFCWVIVLWICLKPMCVHRRGLFCYCMLKDCTLTGGKGEIVLRHGDFVNVLNQFVSPCSWEGTWRYCGLKINVIQKLPISGPQIARNLIIQTCDCCWWFFICSVPYSKELLFYCFVWPPFPDRRGATINRWIENRITYFLID